MKNGKNRHFELNVHEYEVKGYGIFKVRDLSVKQFKEVSKIEDSEQRGLAMLAFSILNEDGTPVGMEEIENYPMIVFTTLVDYINENNIAGDKLGGTENADQNPLMSMTN